LHYHPIEEELFVVLSGRCVLETPRGRTELKAGAFAACPAGERGTHRLVNPSEQPCVVLCLSDVVPHDAPEQAGLVDFRKDLVTP
jgi:uncharacterized cupin superfamily protein